MIKNWIPLNSESQLQEAVTSSYQRPVVFFKHSTRCSISSMALNRLSRLDISGHGNAMFYYLDLLSYRNLSNKIADNFGVIHESPQLLLIKNGDCVFEASHSEIAVSELQEQLNQVA